ncbi:MAG: hypothetical protein AAGA60_08375 [Cyanobacteria bacterium P01_E01_bin.42]
MPWNYLPTSPIIRHRMSVQLFDYQQSDRFSGDIIGSDWLTIDKNSWIDSISTPYFWWHGFWSPPGEPLEHKGNFPCKEKWVNPNLFNTPKSENNVSTTPVITQPDLKQLDLIVFKMLSQYSYYLVLPKLETTFFSELENGKDIVLNNSDPSFDTLETIQKILDPSYIVTSVEEEELNISDFITQQLSSSVNTQSCEAEQKPEPTIWNSQEVSEYSSGLTYLILGILFLVNFRKKSKPKT